MGRRGGPCDCGVHLGRGARDSLAAFLTYGKSGNRGMPPSNGTNRAHGAVAHRRPWGWTKGQQEGPAWIQDDIKDQMPTPKPGIIEATV